MQIKKMPITKPAFTLAEVLIALVIIGIIATITVHTLYVHYAKKSTIVQLQKAYVEIQNALRYSELQHGSMSSWNFSNATNNFYEKGYLTNNIDVIHYCDETDASDTCWATTYTLQNTIAFKNNGKGYHRFITKSGYSVLYWISASGTNGHVIIDIDGPKGQNKYGKDVFRFGMYFRNNSIIPGVYPFNLYTPDTTRESITNNCNKTTTGMTCSALLVYDGWKFSNDYPW